MECFLEEVPYQLFGNRSGVLHMSPVPEHSSTQSDFAERRQCVSQQMGERKEGNYLFNDALNTFYLRLYGVRYMVKDNSDSERENPLPPHGLLFPINSKGSFICTIPQTG